MNYGRLHEWSCGKQVFPSQVEADRAARAVQRRAPRGKLCVNAYFCQGCGGWHWGHLPKRIWRPANG